MIFFSYHIHFSLMTSILLALVIIHWWFPNQCHYGSYPVPQAHISVNIGMFPGNFNHTLTFKLNIRPQLAFSPTFSILVKHHSPKCVWGPGEQVWSHLLYIFLWPSIPASFQPLSIFSYQCLSFSVYFQYHFRSGHTWTSTCFALYHWRLTSGDSVWKTSSPSSFYFNLINEEGGRHVKN